MTVLGLHILNRNSLICKEGEEFNEINLVQLRTPVQLLGQTCLSGEYLSRVSGELDLRLRLH